MDKTTGQNVDEAALTVSGLEAAFAHAKKMGEVIAPKEPDTRGDAKATIVGAPRYAVSFTATGEQLEALRAPMETVGVKATTVSL